MKIGIDASIMTSQDGPFGNVTGEIELEIAPAIGDVISFASPGGQIALPKTSFTGVLTVSNRILKANSKAGSLISLSDIVVRTREEAEAVAAYLERGFNLFLNVYNGRNRNGTS